MGADGGVSDGNQNILAGEEVMKFWLLEIGVENPDLEKKNGEGPLTPVGSFSLGYIEPQFVLVVSSESRLYFFSTSLLWDILINFFLKFGLY